MMFRGKQIRNWNYQKEIYNNQSLSSCELYLLPFLSSSTSSLFLLFFVSELWHEREPK
jgi:hypothetical protein